jgi:hypothetical protein
MRDKRFARYVLLVDHAVQCLYPNGRESKGFGDQNAHAQLVASPSSTDINDKCETPESL